MQWLFTICLIMGAALLAEVSSGQDTHPLLASLETQDLSSDDGSCDSSDGDLVLVSSTACLVDCPLVSLVAPCPKHSLSMRLGSSEPIRAPPFSSNTVMS